MPPRFGIKLNSLIEVCDGLVVVDFGTVEAASGKIGLCVLGIELDNLSKVHDGCVVIASFGIIKCIVSKSLFILTKQLCWCHK
jgi:hypothetical protein